jgi:L-ascorbate metabolism protein UlaG (beta-lactamase superfamily)
MSMFTELRKVSRVAPMALWLAGPPSSVPAPPPAPPAESDYTAPFDGTRFTQPEPVEHPLGDWAKRQRTSKRGAWPDFTNSPLGSAPAGSVCDGEITVTFINHATLLIQMDGVNILTDPIWAARSVPTVGVKRRRPAGIRFEDLPRIDAVVVSHNHHDHMDIPTLRRLWQHYQPPVFVGLRSSVFLERKGIGGGHDLDWWQSAEIAPGITVTAVPARHHSNRSLFDRNRMLWCGFVVSGPSGSVYFAGDTGWGRHFEEIGKRFPNIKVALLPIGGFMPEWYQRKQHIGPVDALQATRDVGATTMIPMHFGTFPNGAEGEGQAVSVLVDAVAAQPDMAERVVILDNGQSWSCGEVTPALQDPESVQALHPAAPELHPSTGPKGGRQGRPYEDVVGRGLPLSSTGP